MKGHKNYDQSIIRLPGQYLEKSWKSLQNQYFYGDIRHLLHHCYTISERALNDKQTFKIVS